MNWLTLLPMIVSAAGTVKNIIDIASSNADIVTKIKSAVPSIVDVLEDYATQLFPKVAPQLKVAAAAMSAFDPNVTKWLQGSLNALYDAGLEVDGLYGPKTRAAVEAVQEKLGLKVDGWAGTLTQAAIQAALSKNPEIK